MLQDDAPPLDASSVQAHRRSEVHIRELQARLAELQQIGQIGSWWFDPRSLTSWWSEETYRLFGIDPASDSPTFPQFLQSVHPHDRSQLEHEFRNAVEHLSAFQWEFRVIRPDGVTLWIESRGYPKFDADGTFLRFEGTNQDLTLRKQRELEELDREARLRSAFDHMLEGLQVVGFDLHIRYINHAAVLQARRPRQQIVGQHIGDVYPNLQSTELYSALHQCLTKRVPISLRSNFGFADIQSSAFDISLQPVPEGVLILSFDVTPQHLVELELQAKEEELEVFFETSNVGMSVWKFDGRPIRINETSCRLLGYSREQLLALHLSDIVLPDDWIESQKMLIKLKTGELKNYQAHRRYVRQDGSILHSLVYVATNRYRNGKPESFAAVLLDRSSHVDLEERVRQSQKMEAVGRLAGGVAHDFNNLLTVITCSSEVLSTHPLVPECKSHVVAIQQAAQRGSDLTQQLLAFSRRQVMAPQLLDLNRIVQKLEFLLRRLVGKSIELTTELALKLPRIKADPTQLEQVILNLVINARDAIVESSGRICISTAYIPDYAWEGLTTTSWKNQGAVELCVSDSGPGIPVEVRSRVFEPFFTTKIAGRGTGLGLAVVHGIVEQSEGKIEIDPLTTEGTCMRVLLPVAERVEPATE